MTSIFDFLLQVWARSPLKSIDLFMRLPTSLAIAPLLLLLAGASAASTLALDSDLFYATASSCEAVPTLTQQELVNALFASSAQSFQGHAELSTEAATADDAGCRLHLQVRGDLSPLVDTNAIQVTSSLHQMMMQLLQQQSSLRGSSSSDLKDLSLLRVLVKTSSKDFTLTLDEAEFMKPSSQMITSGGCAQLRSQDVLPQILPQGVSAGELESFTTVANNAERSACSVAVDLVAQVQPSHERNVFSLLQVVDANLDSVYADQTLLHANVKLQQHPSDATTTLESTPTLNLPSKTIVLSILFGISALTAMLLGILSTKSRHEKRCQERYNKASRAAQISRVSIRMGYEGLPRDAMEDEEEKEELL